MKYICKSMNYIPGTAAGMSNGTNYRQAVDLLWHVAYITTYDISFRLINALRSFHTSIFYKEIVNFLKGDSYQFNYITRGYYVSNQVKVIVNLFAEHLFNAYHNRQCRKCCWIN